MKLIALAALASTTALATPASAGVYLNVENNGSRVGSEYLGSVTDLHVGYEGGSEKATFYIQGGPAIVSEHDEDSDRRLSGKVGGNFQATDKLGVYGELSLLTAEEDSDDDTSWGTKVGIKYSF
jgi:hypothetical protein|tara:strand:+ start:241 stop:612 length:372 start_codon:yes stop_codon:yes gene_type:complete